MRPITAVRSLKYRRECSAEARCQRSETDDDGPRADDECRFVMNTEDGDSHIFEGARKPVCEREACSLDNCWCSGVDRTDGFSDCECSERRRRSSKTQRTNRDTGDADTTSTVIDQMRFSDSSKEEKLTTEFCVSPVRCIGIAGAVRISAGHALAITHCVAVWSEGCCATPAVSRFALKTAHPMNPLVAFFVRRRDEFDSAENGDQILLVERLDRSVTNTFPVLEDSHTKVSVISPGLLSSSHTSFDRNGMRSKPGRSASPRVQTS